MSTSQYIMAVPILFSVSVQASGRSCAQGEHVMTSVVAGIASEGQFQAETLLAAHEQFSERIFFFPDGSVNFCMTMSVCSD